jgi:hypothetical protein
MKRRRGLTCVIVRPIDESTNLDGTRAGFLSPCGPSGAHYGVDFTNHDPACREATSQISEAQAATARETTGRETTARETTGLSVFRRRRAA